MKALLIYGMVKDSWKLENDYIKETEPLMIYVPFVIT